MAILLNKPHEAQEYNIMFLIMLMKKKIKRKKKQKKKKNTKLAKNKKQCNKFVINIK